MIISMIAALGKNQVIGNENRMPWHLPADLKWFKQKTLGSPVIMGRKTFESIGRPLPGRLNIILTRNPELQIDGCTVVNTPEQALKAAGDVPEVFITGGAYLYELFLEQADRLYLTQIDLEPDGDTFFPNYRRYAWREIDRIDHPSDEVNPFGYSFVTLQRVRSTASTL